MCRLPSGAGRVDPTSSRLLLRLLARRTTHPAAMYGLRFRSLLQQRALRRLSPMRSIAHRDVSGLSRVGCVAQASVAVLDVSLVEEPTTPRATASVAAAIPSSANGEPAGCVLSRQDSTNSPAAPWISPTPPAFGQQLFLANVQSTRHTLRSRVEPPAGRPSRAKDEHLKRVLPRLASVAHGQRFSPVPWNQLALFASEPDAVRGHRSRHDGRHRAAAILR